ncbi:hypothetical protein FQR65_LT20794 [Abscondita terminalis]|nr:hypothetical protein FQR65_LT20794 [Abscondita terminalis]
MYTRDVVGHRRVWIRVGPSQNPAASPSSCFGGVAYGFHVATVNDHARPSAEATSMYEGDLSRDAPRVDELPHGRSRPAAVAVCDRYSAISRVRHRLDGDHDRDGHAPLAGRAEAGVIAASRSEHGRRRGSTQHVGLAPPRAWTRLPCAGRLVDRTVRWASNRRRRRRPRRGGSAAGDGLRVAVEQKRQGEGLAHDVVDGSGIARRVAARGATWQRGRRHDAVPMGRRRRGALKPAVGGGVAEAGVDGDEFDDGPPWRGRCRKSGPFAPPRHRPRGPCSSVTTVPDSSMCRRARARLAEVQAARPHGGNGRRRCTGRPSRTPAPRRPPRFMEPTRSWSSSRPSSARSSTTFRGTEHPVDAGAGEGSSAIRCSRSYRSAMANRADPTPSAPRAG